MVSDRERIKAHMSEKAALYKEDLRSQFDRLFCFGGDEIELLTLEPVSVALVESATR
jgi:hypothetical protein